MDAKHTPGPWDGDSAPGIIQDSKGRIIAQLEEDYDDSDGNHADWPEEEQETNARLIAAAPELLAACVGMLEWARRVQAINPGPEVYNACCAIAKATGTERQGVRQ